MFNLGFWKQNAAADPEVGRSQPFDAGQRQFRDHYLFADVRESLQSGFYPTRDRGYRGSEQDVIPNIGDQSGRWKRRTTRQILPQTAVQYARQTAHENSARPAVAAAMSNRGEQIERMAPPQLAGGDHCGDPAGNIAGPQQYDAVGQFWSGTKGGLRRLPLVYQGPRPPPYPLPICCQAMKLEAANEPNIMPINMLCR